VVYNCNFTNLDNYANPFIIVSGYTGPGGSISYLNNRFEYALFPLKIIKISIGISLLDKDQTSGSLEF